MTIARQDTALTVIPSGKAVGAEVIGVDLSAHLDDAAFATIESAFDDHSVLCLRDQTIGAAAFVEFARRFGAVEYIYLGHYAHPQHREIMLISNIQEEGRNIGHADAGRVWHTDMSYTDTPPRATLHAIEVPEAEDRTLGDTLFASATAAYDALPAEMKARVAGLRAVHQVSGRRRRTGTGTEDNKFRDQQPDVIHPVVRTHPVTGRKAIYVSEGECIGILGMPDAEALPLITELARHVTRPEFQYRHQWRVGDVLIWDNPAVQHLAVHDYEWPRHRRLMHRITVGGSATFE